MDEKKNSIAMFDQIKGLGMIAIILSHTISIGTLFQNLSENVLAKIFFVLVVSIANVLIPLFFVISGYGFRKMPIKKCVKNQVRFLLKPYLVIAFFSGIIHLCCHYLAFRYWPGAVKETLKVIGGYAFALPSNQTFFGVTLFFCGAAWYLAALMIGWILLDVIEVLTREKYVKWFVLLAVFIGWMLGMNKGMFFCISQGMIATGFIYLGQTMKKCKYLNKRVTAAETLVLLMGILVAAVSMFVTGTIDNMADGVWGLGLFSIIWDGLLGVMLLRYSMLVAHNGLSILGVLGKYSLMILGVHAVEMTAIPWYLLEKIWMDKWYGGLIQFAVRFVTIMLVTYSVCIILKRKKEFVTGRRKNKCR